MGEPWITGLELAQEVLLLPTKGGCKEGALLLTVLLGLGRKALPEVVCSGGQSGFGLHRGYCVVGLQGRVTA